MTGLEEWSNMVRIGVDIGGTFVKLGLVDGANRILCRRIFPFPGPSPEILCRRLREESLSLLEEAGCSFRDLSLLGTVVPGTISSDGSTVLEACNLGYRNLPLLQALQDTFPELRVSLRNDADGAALAELRFGALKGCRTAVLLTLGTGVGSSIILNGEIFHGGTGYGVELGHTVLVDGGLPCACGNRGCMEVYCSATALAILGRKACRSNPLSSLITACGGDEDSLDAKTVVDSAKAGDPAAKAAFEEYLCRLSSACVSIYNTLDPEVLAIGGGLSGSGSFLFDPLGKAVDEKLAFRSRGRLIPSRFGNDSGIIGAVAE